MEQLDCVVVGAGVVGLAVARELALRGRDVLVLEAADAIGTGISSRNSEVVHAGIYYPRHSLKASLCVRGRQMLYAYCAQRGIGHRRCGKLIVATASDQEPELAQLRVGAQANGVELQMLTRAQAREMEPQLECAAALWSPDTGIIDSHSFMLSLVGDLEHAGGLLALQAPLEKAACTPQGIRLSAAGDTQLLARTVVNAAGLQAPALARRFEGLNPRHVPTPYFAKGSYFTLVGRSPFSRLIYPVPERAGLGVHLTLDLGGQAKFGPDVQWVDDASDLGVDLSRAIGFYEAIRRYWPGLQDGALMPGYAGIRPKIRPPSEGAADFLVQGPAVHGIAGLVNLFGIESPGLTSALALAQHVADVCEAQTG
ncbi:MAG: NAD(P)/FAD-dependent oxidoreductase [Burkholderiaceae bacterium]